MNTIARLLRAIRNPRLFARGLNRAYHRRGVSHSNQDGFDVFAADWDQLVVLDACRYDMFAENNTLPGELSERISQGSATAEWLGANIEGKNLRDTVYVTSNPQLERNRHRWDVSFHAVENVWIEEGWDDEAGTVLAETMVESALEAAYKYPDKRLVVHFMQPHYPFVPSNTTFDKEHLSTIENASDETVGENVWNQMFMGDLNITRDELWEMYCDNLRYVLNHVEGLLAEFEGKTVVTSDHGNFVGERASPIPIREWGHPRGIYDDILVRVPWFEYTNGPRRNIVSGESEAQAETVDSKQVAERLRDLGYAE